MSLRAMMVSFGLVALAAVPAAAFHNHLTKSMPAADEAGPSPKSIRLWFAEKVNPKFSSITLMKADSSKIEVAKPVATDDPKSIMTDVPATLEPGRYLIRWRTAGDDGHAVRGTFSFSVK